MNVKKIAYCTIITIDYLHYALTLNESLLRHNPNVLLKILIADHKKDLSAIANHYPNIEFYFVDHLCKEGIAKEIYEKYAATQMDCFRWSMKPVLISYLLDQNYDQVFFLDCDLYFFAPYDFLSDDLDGNGVLLTPHWRAVNPKEDAANFSILQTSGLFNAGFVGVSQDGAQAMEWWANACFYKCKKAPHEGLFVDQAYLDILPVYFDNVKIERHHGCNVANWNQIECKRILVEKDKIAIKGGFDIIFIHFTGSTVNGIKSGQDSLLKNHLAEYQKTLNGFECWVRKALSFPFSGSISATKKSNQKKNLTLNDLFINPKLSFRTLDIYYIRKSIVTALNNNIWEFKGKLLDIGCGQMPYKPLLTGNSRKITQYIGLDFDENPIHNNFPDITWQEGKIPLADGSIDCAICTEVFEHCPTPEEVMSEIHRVLKPGGLLFFTVPFFWPMHEVPYDEYRYTPYSLKRHLTNSKFIDIQIEPLGGWDASLAQMLGLWVRRRPMGKFARLMLSCMFMPLIYLLYKKDGKVRTYFQESMMVTGISGTAKKPKENIFTGDK